MAPQASDPEALAATFLEAERAVVLTGLRLGGPESRDLTHANGEWAQRASLEAFLTEPGRFWEYFYPTAAAHRRARARARRTRPSPASSAAGVITDLITQAVNRLHSRAGSPDPVEVYGTVLICALRALRRALCPAGGRRADRAPRPTGSPAAPPPAAGTRCDPRGPCGASRSPARRSSTPGRSPPRPTPSSSSTRICARRRSRCCPRSRSRAARRWCWSARRPPSTTATPRP